MPTHKFGGGYLNKFVQPLPKGAYPYDYMNSWTKLQGNHFAEKKVSIEIYTSKVLSEPDGLFHVKWCKPGHDPSKNLIKICQVITIYKMW